MNHSGDAAEQIVRMSLEGVEVAAKITGSMAKEISVFLLAALKNNDKSLKLKGKARLTSMLKSGKALEIFSMKESELRSFSAGAKEYGIVYCVLRKKQPDGLCDVMVKVEDSPKISRLIERYRIATVDRAVASPDIPDMLPEEPPRPFAEPLRPSELTSESRRKSERVTRPSVREELRKIKSKSEEPPKREAPPIEIPRSNPVTTHNQPSSRGKRERNGMR